ncbi:MAG: four helix bundle protein [Acidobacteria bacterium]|nr:four helix bundle protein [Acidobacteriota bacterium]
MLIIVRSAIEQFDGVIASLRKLGDSPGLSAAGKGLALSLGMTPQELRARLDLFADDVIALCRALPADRVSVRLAAQLQDAATSVAANYRAACRAQTRATFVAKLSIALEEADESGFWLRRLLTQKVDPRDVIVRLMNEADEITKILSASRRTAQGAARRK